ncbi:UNVERIFIED_CONTAM: hypothetical protein FKN15_013526 [Acipenser sinensis]
MLGHLLLLLLLLGMHGMLGLDQVPGVMGRGRDRHSSAPGGEYELLRGVRWLRGLGV